MTPKLTTTRERHKSIFKVYEQVLDKHGEDAKYLKKERLYEEVANIVNMNPKSIGFIINEQLKGQGTRTEK